MNKLEVKRKKKTVILEIKMSIQGINTLIDIKDLRPQQLQEIEDIIDSA